MFADEIVFTNMNDSEVTERDKQYYNHGAEDLANALLILMNMKSSEIQDLFLIEDNETSIQNLLKSEGYETIVEKIKNWDGDIIFTKDTHYNNYLNTREGRHLPIKHCLQNTPGYNFPKDIASPSLLSCSLAISYASANILQNSSK